MAADDVPEDSRDGTDAVDETASDDTEAQTARERIEESADRAVEEFDQGIVDLLAWLLDTETRARIYVYLRKRAESTSEEVADGTGLYPSTVREALAELHEEEVVTRKKRESTGAGNNPYEYEAIAPSELVRNTVGQVQQQLNTVFTLDCRFDENASDEEGPVTITVHGDQQTTVPDEQASVSNEQGTEPDERTKEPDDPEE